MPLLQHCPSLLALLPSWCANGHHRHLEHFVLIYVATVTVLIENFSPFACSLRGDNTLNILRECLRTLSQKCAFPLIFVSKFEAQEHPQVLPACYTRVTRRIAPAVPIAGERR